MTVATEQEAEAVKSEIASDGLGLVITDIHLSNNRQAQGGVRLFERWTAAAPTLPFLFMSENANDANLPAIRARKASFIAKPVIRREILDAVAVRLLNAYPPNRSI